MPSTGTPHCAAAAHALVLLICSAAAPSPQRATIIADPPHVVARVATAGMQAKFPATLDYVSREDSIILTSFSDQSDALHDAGFTGSSYMYVSRSQRDSSWKKLDNEAFPWLIIGLFETSPGAVTAFSYPLRHAAGANYSNSSGNVQSASLAHAGGRVLLAHPGNLTIGFPPNPYRQPMTPAGANNSFSFSTTGPVIDLHSGGKLAFLYGTFAGHTAGFTSLIVVKSADSSGQGWEYLSTIAGYSDPRTFTPAGTPELCKTPSESDTIYLVNGSLFTVFRSSGGPLCSSLSHTDGENWTVPVVMGGCKSLGKGVPGPWGSAYPWGPRCPGAPLSEPDWFLYGVRPRLARLPNGMIALTAGRPGIFPYIADAAASAWQRFNLAAAHNRLSHDDIRFSADVPGGGVNGTTSYTGLLALGGSSNNATCSTCANQVLVTYDRLGAGWGALGKGQVSAVLSMKLTVTPAPEMASV